MRFAALLLAALLPITAHAARYSHRQLTALAIAAQEGSRYDNAIPLQAIILLESSACQDKGSDSRASLGCGQIQLRAAESVAQGQAVSADNLRRDDHLNIHLSAKYLGWCIGRFHSRELGVICYRRGPQAAASYTQADLIKDPYLRAMRALIKSLEKSYD